MDENELARRCQRQEMEAYRMVYDRYHQPMLRTARRLLNNQQDAEDALQMTFLKLYRGVKGFKFKSSFSTYIYRILVRVCYDILRKRRDNPEQKLHTQIAKHETGRDQIHLLETAIASLPARMRACFSLHAIEGFKLREIAVMLEMKEGTVKATIHHAKRKLRHRLWAEVEEEPT